MNFKWEISFKMNQVFWARKQNSALEKFILFYQAQWTKQVTAFKTLIIKYYGFFQVILKFLASKPFRLLNKKNNCWFYESILVIIALF